ncbi:peptide ABC transporter substrate-binding protein [Pseudoroseomonas wenyumeiae]|uniref:Peptide ABC transporter substrate-binding protein n=1 Tax=Teichococcus wenyumeiae TaxID=2478470 RepID=A0A3A9J9B7_9PROT|nr:peptide ABC transporter substrate-binding protein [Pseudoroseomonas wenyumeiae]RKK03857.1 peptide ABC transporter substrate-binding protein [Pseudoroseomonas wenyumeiae]RMI17091.1 peptide ABC transporter substrate-binding protein [Pseudoroseomonas wenyumeiae]
MTRDDSALRWHRILAPTRRGLFAIGGAAALAAGPARAQGASRPPEKPKGQVIVGLSQEPTVFHPLMPGIEVDQGVWWNLFSTLWYIDPAGQFVPDLAAEVPTQTNGGISEDGLLWKVKLRRDAKWHDGTPFTAEDVKFSLDLINNPDFRVRNRVGHSLVKEIKVTAPDQIEWRMETAYAPYLSILSLTFMVPKHLLAGAADPNGTPFQNAPVGTGPFRWGSRTPGDNIQLTANTAYHGRGPYLERVVFKYIPDVTVMYTQFRTGQIDYTGIAGISPNFAREAKALRGRKVQVNPTASVESIAPNLEAGALADKTVRQALYMAMNKKALIEALYYGLPTPTESFLPQQSWAINPDLPKHEYNPAKANEMLDAAGWKRGAGGIREKGGVRLEFSNSTTVGNPIREQAQQLLMQDWKAIGAGMRIQNMPAAVIWGEFWQQSKYNSVMVSVNYMLGSDPDVTPRFSSKAIPAKGGRGQNTFQFQNAEVDDLLLKGATTFDQEKRKEVYGRIQQVIREELAILPIFQQTLVEGTKDNLMGFQPNINTSSNCWNIREWYWA